MALLDFLKKKEEIEKAKSGKKTGPEVSVAKKPAKEKKNEEVAAAPVTLPVGPFSYGALQVPHISEKSTVLGQYNQYVFRVSPRANKLEIKRAVEGMYKVTVQSVNVIKVPAKKRRVGRSQGFKKGYVKAVVTVKNGQKIDII